MWLTTLELLLERMHEVFPDDGKSHAVYITEDACYIDGKLVHRDKAIAFPGAISDVQVHHSLDYRQQEREEE